MWFAWLMIFGGLVGAVLLLYGLYALKSGVVFGKYGPFERRSDPVTYFLWVSLYLFLGSFQLLFGLLFGFAAFLA